MINIVKKTTEKIRWWIMVVTNIDIANENLAIVWLNQFVHIPSIFQGKDN